MIQVSSGPPVVFGGSKYGRYLGDDSTAPPAAPDLGTALGGLKWLALAVGAWFIWNAVKRSR